MQMKVIDQIFNNLIKLKILFSNILIVLCISYYGLL